MFIRIHDDDLPYIPQDLCPSCGEPIPYRSLHCNSCGANIAWGCDQLAKAEGRSPCAACGTDEN